MVMIMFLEKDIEKRMNEPTIGTVIEMDASQMIASVVINSEIVVDVNVERVYNFGEEIEVLMPWYLQEDEEICDYPIKLAQGCIKGVRVG